MLVNRRPEKSWLDDLERAHWSNSSLVYIHIYSSNFPDELVVLYGTCQLVTVQNVYTAVAIHIRGCIVCVCVCRCMIQTLGIVIPIIVRIRKHERVPVVADWWNHGYVREKVARQRSRKRGQITVCGAHPHVRQPAVCVGFVSHRQLFQFIYIFIYIFPFILFYSLHPSTVIIFFPGLLSSATSQTWYMFQHTFTRSYFQQFHFNSHLYANC